MLSTLIVAQASGPKGQLFCNTDSFHQDNRQHSCNDKLLKHWQDHPATKGNRGSD